jgi:glutamate synthase domain-containing protein 3
LVFNASTNINGVQIPSAFGDALGGVAAFTSGTNIQVGGALNNSATSSLDGGGIVVHSVYNTSTRLSVATQRLLVQHPDQGFIY